MATEISSSLPIGSHQNNRLAINMKDTSDSIERSPCVSVHFIQTIIAEVLGTYFLIFAGCAAVVVNKAEDNVITLPGISTVWGLAVAVLANSVGHVSGGHFNPAVTIAFATCSRFPWKKVPVYIISQVIGSTLAGGTLRLIFTGRQDHFAGTMPAGSNMQSFVIEFIITFYLMFVISGVGTDDRAVGELAGVLVGATVLLNVMFAGAISGASMNPARSLGPAIVWKQYKSLWVYIVAPTCGAICGAWAYNSLRSTGVKRSSFLKPSPTCGTSPSP